MDWFRDRLRNLGAVANLIGALLFLAMFGGFVIQVFSRYVMGQPLGWTIDFIRIAAVWTVFWAGAFMVPIRQHVSIDIAYAACPPEVRRVLSIATLAIAAGVFLMSLPALYDYITFLQRRRSPVLGWPMMWVFGCYLLFVLGYVAQSLWQLRGLISRSWREHLDGGTAQ